MTNSYFNSTGVPQTRARGYSAVIRAVYDAIAAGFDKFPTLSGGNANKALVVNGAGTAVTLTTGTLTLAGNLSTAAAFTMSGAYAFTGTLTGITAVTYPLLGTLATLAGAETFTNKTLTSPIMTGPTLGTPASGNLSNCTAYPTSALAGLGTGVATFLATPSSANLRAALTDETGTGAAYFQNGDLGTPSAGVGTNLTGIPEAGLTLADNTTNNASTTKHGFLKKLDNDATHFMDGQGNWSSVPGGSFVTLATLTPTAVASVSDTTHLTSAYKSYEIELINVIPATNADTLIFQVTQGAATKSDASYASEVNAFRTNAAGLAGGVVADATGTYIQLTRTSLVANTAAHNGVSGIIRISDPANATGKKFIDGLIKYAVTGASSTELALVAGHYTANNTAVDGFTLSFLGGDIASGRIIIRGRQ